MKYRTINVYRSAISMTHVPVDGSQIGSHPLVSCFMKGVFELRPPQPKYLETWDVSIVLKYLLSLSPKESLSLKQLSFKVLTLMALTSMGRANLLHKLDLRFRYYKSEGVLFKFPSLLKTSKPGKVINDLFIPAYPADRRLCLVNYLRHYEEQTKVYRESDDDMRLFLSTVAPHKPVQTSTLCRWLKTVLKESGVDVSIYQGHSTRSASSSAALNAGATISDILQVGKWSREYTFCKFYNRSNTSSFTAQKILSFC